MPKLTESERLTRLENAFKELVSYLYRELGEQAIDRVLSTLDDQQSRERSDNAETD